MKKGKRPLALLGALVLALLLGASGAAAEGEPGAPGCRYFYQLVRETAAETGQSVFSLYAQRTEEAGAPLHAGSITLAADVAGDLTFTPAAGWETMSVPYPTSPDPDTAAPAETGVTDSGLQYISFGWYWGMGTGGSSTAPPAGSEGNPSCQLLGTLTVPAPDLQVENVKLLPWPETATGKAQIADWQAAADQEAFREVIENTWHMPAPSLPGQGYYQGFYAGEREAGDETGGMQYAVDLAAGWQGFTIGAFAPGKPATLLFYQTVEGERTLTATAQAEFDAGTGYFTGRIDFASLHYTEPDGTALAALPDSTYDLVLTKPSHVTCELRGLAFSNQDCPTLLGLHVELPCGDIDLAAEAADGGVWLGDGRVKQADRVLLLSYIDRATALDATSSTMPDGGPNGAYFADLNGDGRVSAADLEVLMAPGNWNKRSIVRAFLTG